MRYCSAVLLARLSAIVNIVSSKSVGMSCRSLSSYTLLNGNVVSV